MPRAKSVLREPQKLPNKADQFAFNQMKAEKGLNWKDVDSVSLKAAILNATSEGVAVMFSGAAGGKGICLRLLLGGDRREVVYAMDAEDLNQFLEQVTDAFHSGAEDPYLALRGGK